MLELTGLSYNPRGVKLRYKLVELPGVTGDHVRSANAGTSTSAAPGVQDVPVQKSPIQSAARDIEIAVMTLGRALSLYVRAETNNNARLATKALDHALAALADYNVLLEGTGYVVSNNIIQAFAEARSNCTEGRLVLKFTETPVLTNDLSQLLKRLKLVELDFPDWDDMSACDLADMLLELPSAFVHATTTHPAYVEGPTNVLGKTFAFATSQGTTGMVRLSSVPMLDCLPIQFKTLRTVPPVQTKQ